MKNSNWFFTLLLGGIMMILASCSIAEAICGSPLDNFKKSYQTTLAQSAYGMSYHDNIMDSLIMVDRYETGRSVQYTFHDQESDSIWAVIWYEETGKYFGEMDIWSRPDTLGNLDNGWTNEYIYCTCWSVDTIPNCWWEKFPTEYLQYPFLDEN